MRFSIRDLLLLTLFIAMSSALIGITFDGIPPNRLVRYAICGVFSGLIWLWLTWFASSFEKHDPGELLAVVPDERFEIHFAGVCLYLLGGIWLLSLLSKLFSEPINNVFPALILIGTGFVQWFSGRKVSIFERGVIARRRFTSWSNHLVQFKPRDEENHLVIGKGLFSSAAKLTTELATKVKDLIAAQRGA